MEECEKRVVYDTLEEEAETFDLEVEGVVTSRRITVLPSSDILDIIQNFCRQVLFCCF